MKLIFLKGVNMKDLKSKMEVLIFISEKPISLKNISEFLNIDKNEAEILINDLMNEINNLRRSFKLEKIADGYQFRTNEDYKNLIKEFINKKPFRLSRASLEVAGIIAKRQPITKLEIDKIRGVDSTGVINVLLERDIIKVSGEKNAPGKPYLYKTTDFFLEVFSLNDISEIPDIDEFNDYDASET